MDGLDGTAEHKLDPEVPVPVQVGLEEATDDGADNGSTDRRQDDKCDGVLLIVCVPEVGDWMYAYGNEWTGDKNL